MRFAAQVVTSVFLFASSGRAQSPKASPGPEHKRLEAFVGTWTYERELKSGPVGSGAKPGEPIATNCSAAFSWYAGTKKKVPAAWSGVST